MPTVLGTGFFVVALEEKKVAWDIIRKQARGKGLFPNLRDYAAVREAFTWKSVRAELAMPGGLNIAYHALDRHIVEGRGDKLALRWLGKNGKNATLPIASFWSSAAVSPIY
jgi:hypothetical protein